MEVVNETITVLHLGMRNACGEEQIFQLPLKALGCYLTHIKQRYIFTCVTYYIMRWDVPKTSSFFLFLFCFDRLCVHHNVIVKF